MPDQKRIWINTNGLSSEQKIVDLEKQIISSYESESLEPFDDFSIPLTGARHKYTILYSKERGYFTKAPYLFNLMSSKELKPLSYKKNFDFALMLPTPDQALFVNSDANTIDISNILTGEVLKQVQASIPHARDFSITPNGEVLTILGDNKLYLKNLNDKSESKISMKGEDPSDRYSLINMISNRYGIVAGNNTIYLFDSQKEGINLTKIFTTESKSHYIPPKDGASRPFLAFISRP